MQVNGFSLTIWMIQFSHAKLHIIPMSIDSVSVDLATFYYKNDYKKSAADGSLYEFDNALSLFDPGKKAILLPCMQAQRHDSIITMQLCVRPNMYLLHCSWDSSPHDLHKMTVPIAFFVFFSFFARSNCYHCSSFSYYVAIGSSSFEYRKERMMWLTKLNCKPKQPLYWPQWITYLHF